MKKSNVIILAIMVGIISIGVGYDHGWARARQAIMPAKVGVVRVDMILKTSRKHALWQSRMDLERKKIRTELEKLDKEAEAIKDDLATRQAGSTDYLTLLASYMEKTSTIDAREKYYEQEVRIKMRLWTEKLYEDIINISQKVAKAKGLDIVLASQDVEFPTPTVMDLANMMRTNKVLYHSPDMDITAEVLAELDSSM